MRPQDCRQLQPNFEGGRPHALAHCWHCCPVLALVLVLVPMIHRLRDVNAAGQQASWPEQLLHRQLLDQLQSLPELVGLAPQQLLEEYRALQLMVLYNGSHEAAAGSPEAAAEGVGADSAADKKKALAEDMEEYLAGQVSRPAVSTCQGAPLHAMRCDTYLAVDVHAKAAVGTPCVAS